MLPPITPGLQTGRKKIITSRLFPCLAKGRITIVGAVGQQMRKMHVVALVEILGKTTIPTHVHLIVSRVEPLVELGTGTAARQGGNFNAVAPAISSLFAQTQPLRVVHHRVIIPTVQIAALKIVGKNYLGHRRHAAK